VNVKALMLGLALAGLSTAGAHATVIFPTSPDALGLGGNQPAFDNTNGPIGGGIKQLPLQPLAVVPEPVTWAMMLVGLGGLGMAMRGARRKPAMASTTA
jgi:hypothetical protein